MLRISKLTLRGFKSFGKPTVIDFPKGFTAIVGPNGSGKSNIIDSVCFVLGRLSSKSLRADRMSELIFSGSKGSNASTRAEVIMRFDNTDKDLPVDTPMVDISREILKDGNSNYYLNEKKTTRQQIVDVLSKAQINPNGHNIVLQGDVSEIIEMNPVERRGILDEISGIAEYESKKERALGELQKVESKIEEAMGVYRERERYLASIEKERNDALRYKEVTNELKQRRAEIFKVKIQKTDTELAKIKSDMAEEEAKKTKIAGEMGERQAEEKKLEEEIKGIDDELQKKGEKERAELNLEIQKCGINIAKTDKDLQANKEEAKRADETAASAQKKEKDMAEKEKALREKIAALEAENKPTNEILAHKQKEFKIMQAQAIGADQEKTKLIDSAIDSHNKATAKLHQLEKTQNTLSEFIRLKKSELEELQKKEKGAEANYTSIDAEHRQLEGKIKEIAGRIAKAEEEAAKLERDRTNAAVDLRKMEQEIALKMRERARAESEKSAQKDYAGFGEAVKEIMDQAKKGAIKGVHGTVAELGQVKEAYALALKTAAGGRLQNIVVDNEDIAIACIRHLKAEKRGRATFLPLNRLKTHGIEAPPKESLGLAIDLIKFDPRYQAAFEHVFTDTIVVEDLEIAKRIGIGKRRTVTLDGDLVESSGAMTGGHHSKKSEGGFPVRELEELEERLSAEITGMDAKKQKLDEEHGKIKERIFAIQTLISSEKGEKEKTRMTLEGLQIKSASIRDISEKIKRLEAEIREAEEKSGKLAIETGLAGKEEAEAKNAADEIRQKTGETKDTHLAAHLEKEDKEIKELEKRQNLAQTNIRLAGSELEQVVLKGLEEAKSTIKRMEEAHKRLEGQEEALKKMLEELKQKQAQLQEEEKKYSAMAKELLKRKGAAQKEIEGLRERITKHLAKISDVDRVLTGYGIECAKIEQRMSDIQVEGKEYQEITVEITHSEKELEKMIERLEKERDKIGPVNMLALDSFEKIKEDFESLKTKLGKLEEEKNAVLGFIAEVEKTKKDTFMKTFLEISAQFVKTFVRLSPGGEAHLVLEDPENIFTGGLLIKARPKGKELTNIEQMSGGEKAITALAFIFAIQQSHPAPFYVLDEVDAPLDTINSSMLGQMVRELSNSGTQFIVISHHDKMFIHADQLYGVTMTDTGSQIVGVEMKGTN